MSFEPDVEETETVTLDSKEQREQWMRLLGKASDYHYDMSGQFEPDDDDDPDDMAIVARIHRAWAAAIAEACHLIEALETDDVVTEVDVAKGKTKNITKEVNNESEK
tara:strand:- start:3017 stop:3337 length:321 start_codon:yes stop_codon:yes gene_type:complete